MPRVSIVIRAKNEERYIGETLEAIRAQEYQDFEVIVVDSGSTDRTVEIAREQSATIIHIDPRDFTYGRALNLGVAHSRSELLVSLSAHATPESSDWLGSLVSGFRDRDVAGVYGRHTPRENASVFELMGMKLSGITGDERRVEARGARFSNANGAFRRDLWEEVPFNEGLPGAEDIEWVRRILRMGFVIVFEPRASVYHSHGESLPRLLRRQVHDQPVILRSWITGMLHPETTKHKSRMRGRESIAE